MGEKTAASRSQRFQLDWADYSKVGLRGHSSLTHRVDVAHRTDTGSLYRMLTHLVMTIISADRPGLVQLVASTLADHGGNWLESRMGHLGGQFAGIVRAEVSTEQADELVNALQALEQKGLRVIVHRESETVEACAGTKATLEIVGQDRVGILRAVTAVLTNHNINVEELASERVSAPMGGGTLFQATIRVLASSPEELDLVQSDLEKIAADLMVDLRLHPTE